MIKTTLSTYITPQKCSLSLSHLIVSLEGLICVMFYQQWKERYRKWISAFSVLCKAKGKCSSGWFGGEMQLQNGKKIKYG